MAPSWFSGLEVAPPIEVFKLTQNYKSDEHDRKVNLGVGAYLTDEGNPWVLPVVKIVEQNLAADETLNHEYLPVTGLADFTDAAAKLALGEESPVILENRYGAVQSLGGTGALRNGLGFLHSNIGLNTVYVSDPTWGNHISICKAIGYSDVRKYRYWSSDKCAIDFDGMRADLEAAPEKSVILLHAVAHNPTGMDLDENQWMQLSEIMKSRNLFVFFDCAYQGFASGDLEKDAASIRLYVKLGFEMFIAQSFSKNFGLYNERVGNLVYICSDIESLPALKSQLTLCVRANYSNPPNHGGRVVATVLNNPNLLQQWKENVKIMANRILLMRSDLHNKLRELGTPGPNGSWDHITKQCGMFSFLGINEKQVEFIISKYHIYLMKSGRINMCGLNSHNIDYVAGAIHDAVTNVNSKV